MINIVIILVFLIVISKSLYNIFRDLRLHRKRMNNLDEWYKFHRRLFEWSIEIVDQNVKNDFINNFFTINKAVDFLDDFDVSKEKQKVFEKWGKHIPSLGQEIRENKLNKIL